MIIELVKKAGERNLSIELQYEDGMYSAILLDENSEEVYCFESNNVINLELTLCDYLSDPKKFIQSFLDDCKDKMLEVTSGVN